MDLRTIERSPTCFAGSVCTQWSGKKKIILDPLPLSRIMACTLSSLSYAPDDIRCLLRKNYVYSGRPFRIARNDRWFAYLHIQNGGSKIIWILTYSWTGNFLLAWAGQIAGIENQTMHRFEQYLKILQLYHENSRFPPSFKFWSVSTIQKHWEEVKKCILHGFQDLKALFLQ